MHQVILNEKQYGDVFEEYEHMLETLEEKDRNHVLNKREFFFKFLLPTKEIQKICMDEEAAYSVTEAKLAEQMSDIIHQSGSNIQTITDATACVGGNTISFMFHFPSVNSIEYDGTRANFLYHNVKVVSEFYRSTNEHKIGKVSVYEGDGSHPSLKQDAVFFDPPWGGPHYYQERDFHLFLSGEDMEVICARYTRSARLIALKVPYNFAFSSFERAMKSFCTITRHNIGEDKRRRGGRVTVRPKFVLIICKKI